MVQNGIIENYQELREELKGKGYSFLSETDTEVIPNLIADSWATVESESIFGAFLLAVKTAIALKISTHSTSDRLDRLLINQFS